MLDTHLLNNHVVLLFKSINEVALDNGATLGIWDILDKGERNRVLDIRNDNRHLQVVKKEQKAQGRKVLPRKRPRNNETQVGN